MNKSKILQMTVLLAAIVVLAGGFLRAVRYDSMTLTDYESQQNTEDKKETTLNPSTVPAESQGSPEGDATAAPGNAAGTESTPDDDTSAEPGVESGSHSSTAPDGAPSPMDLPSAASRPVGVLLNAGIPEEERITYSQGFYYEPLSENLRRYITGVSYPFLSAAETSPEGGGETADGQKKPSVGSDTALLVGTDGSQPAIYLEELRYVHIWHYDFDGNPREGELICNEYIARDLTEIFYELYRCEYRLEKVLLIDEYDGDDTASMTDNNTSCFNYRQIAGSTSLSKHALGLAVDINPLYNPQVTYEKDGTEVVLPAAASAYADRSAGFSYKIDADDLCCRLFLEHGFTWGGNWNATKDYQHFQKAKP